MKATFDYIDQNYTRYLDFLKEFVTLESPTHEKELVDRCGEGVAEFCRKEGIHVEMTPFSTAGNFYLLSTHPESKEKPVLLLGHMDTVHPVGDYEKPVARIDGEYLRGPGSQDCKGGVVSGLLAMKALMETGCQRPVKFLLCGAEEDCGFCGEEIAAWHIKHARGALAAINTEPYSTGKVVVSRKGIARLTVKIQGKAAHAGSKYDEGISAIKEACYLIPKIESASDMQKVTYNCGLISGGTVFNTVPEFCSFVIDIRSPNFKLMEEAIQRVYDICSKPTLAGTKITVHIDGKRPPMEKTDGNLRLAAFINSVMQKYGFEEIVPSSRGGGSDACYTTLAGVPSVCAFGAYGGGGHTRNEFVQLDSIRTGAQRLAACIAALTDDFH